MKRVLSKLIPLVFLWQIVVTAHAANVLASGVTVNETFTHINIETDQAVKVQSSHLENSSRIVVDIENTQMSPALNALAHHSWKGHARITQLRLLQYAQNTVRIVIDLKKPARLEWKSIAIKPFMQISLDIYPAQVANQQKLAPKKNAHSHAVEDLSATHTGAKIVLEREPVFESDAIEPDMKESLDGTKQNLFY